MSLVVLQFSCIVHASTFCGTGATSVVSSEPPSAKPSQQPVTPEQSPRSDSKPDVRGSPRSGRRSSPRNRHREPVHPLAVGDSSTLRSMCKKRDLKTLIKCSFKN